MNRQIIQLGNAIMIRGSDSLHLPHKCVYSKQFLYVHNDTEYTYYTCNTCKHIRIVNLETLEELNNDSGCTDFGMPED